MQSVNQLKQALAIVALKTAPILTVSAVRRMNCRNQRKFNTADGQGSSATSAHVRLKKDGQLIAEQNLATGQLTASFSEVSWTCHLMISDDPVL